MYQAKELFEAEYLKTLLAMHQNNVTAAARAAGIHRQSFHRLMKRYSLRTRGDDGEPEPLEKPKPTPVPPLAPAGLAS
jgi:DNA-binding NtrC family response regulator